LTNTTGHDDRRSADDETAYLLRDPENARRLVAAIERLESCGRPPLADHGPAGPRPAVSE
jgi:hypothetical protein